MRELSSKPPRANRLGVLLPLASDASACTRTRARIVVAVWLSGVVAAALGAAGCENLNQRFSGFWRTSDPVASTFFSGKVSLALGHYGRELTGVAHYLDGIGTELKECSCSFLALQEIDLAAGTFVAASDHCGDPRWIWRLELDTEGESDALVGTIEEQGGTVTVPVRLDLPTGDRFVPDEQKACGE